MCNLLLTYIHRHFEFNKITGSLTYLETESNDICIQRYQYNSEINKHTTQTQWIFIS